jgi:hypothetical protein
VTAASASGLVEKDLNNENFNDQNFNDQNLNDQNLAPLSKAREPVMSFPRTGFVALWRFEAKRHPVRMKKTRQNKSWSLILIQSEPGSTERCIAPQLGQNMQITIA